MLTQSPGLSNIQKELLKLYSNNISDQELFEVKRLLSEYFEKKATDELDKFLDERGIGEDELIKWSHEHHRSEGGR
jgi:hypothetical protein